MATLREEIEKRLRETQAKLPTSSLARFGRSAMAALRGGRLALHGAGTGELDAGTLTALIASVGQLKGVAMKAAQMMSYLDIPLPEDLRSALTVLQTQSAPMPFETVRAVIERELGVAAPALIDRMDHEPRAAASIGQVHYSRLPDGSEVAVKVQYPDIGKAISADFRSASAGTSLVGLIAPGVNASGVMKEVRDAVLEECDYAHEATYQERFAALYRDHPTIVVPHVYRAYSTTRVLTTQWMAGRSFDTFLAAQPTQNDRDRYGQAIFEFYLGTLLHSGLYNWDPHPGNYVFLEDGRLAMLDYGAAREFPPEFVRKLLALTRAVDVDDSEILLSALTDLGMIQDRGAYRFEELRTLVRAFYGPTLENQVRAIQLGEVRPVERVLSNKRALMGVRLPPEILFVFRIRFCVLSVLARIGASANWYALERGFTAGP